MRDEVLFVTGLPDAAGADGEEVTLGVAARLAGGLGWPLVRAQLGPAAGPAGAVALARRLRGAVASRDPAAVVLSAGSVQRELAGRLAAGWPCALVADCCRLVVADGVVRLSRGALGNRVTAEIEWDRTRPLLLIVAPAALGEPPLGGASWRGGQEPTVGEVKSTDVLDLTEGSEGDEVAQVMAQVRLLRTERLAAGEMDVADAEVVVSGGAGAGGPDGFALLSALAERVGGAVGASRAAVDRGWIGREHQVGNTGKRVAPKLYVAVGISGASQHLAGIGSAGAVLAVNTDRRAPIFAAAELGVLAPMEDVVPELLVRLGAAPGGAAGERLEP